MFGIKLLFLSIAGLVMLSGIKGQSDDESETSAQKWTHEEAVEAGRINSVDPNDIQFLLYTPLIPNTPMRLFPDNVTQIPFSRCLPGAPLKIAFHGFESNASDPWMIGLKNAYIRTGAYNVILVDWSKLCQKADTTIIPNIYVVAKYSSKLINQLLGIAVLNLPSVHLIGHSMGAHVASLTANLASSLRIRRITGLDPARVVFHKFGDDYRLDQSDAPMVDVIHTDGASMGFYETRGTIDFYPNGGKSPQPGCLLHACSHVRAPELFVESISSRTAFRSCKCSSYEDFKKKKCNCNNDATNMGEYASSTATGTYFLKTNYESPFSLTK